MQNSTLSKKRLWRKCFPVNFAKLLRTPLLQNTSGQLLLTVQKHSFVKVLKIGVLKNLYRKRSMLESLFNNVLGLQVYSCELYKIFKNTFLTKHVQVTACHWYQKEVVKFCENFVKTVWFGRIRRHKDRSAPLDTGHKLNVHSWTQHINWTYALNVLSVFWTSYLRSIYVLCPWGQRY